MRLLGPTGPLPLFSLSHPRVCLLSEEEILNQLISPLCQSGLWCLGVCLLTRDANLGKLHNNQGEEGSQEDEAFQGEILVTTVTVTDA